MDGLFMLGSSCLTNDNYTRVRCFSKPPKCCTVYLFHVSENLPQPTPAWVNLLSRSKSKTQPNYFPTIAAACEAIQQFILHAGKSYKTKSSDKKYYTIYCNNSTCPKQYCKGDRQRRYKKYRICSKEKHDKRTCWNQPVANRQQQQARDRALLSLSHSSSNTEQNKIIEEADSTYKDLQVQLEQDLQFRQEMYIFEQQLEQNNI
jgi:hypothetical protein